MFLFDNLEGFKNVSNELQWAIFIVMCLIVLVAVVAIVISIWLSVKYVRFNRKTNSQNITGGEAARKILDDNGLKDIKVSSFGSFLFGNSYSHFFKKVRIRRLTKDKTSLTSLAIGAQKSALAVLDKEGDKDMKHRIALTPFIYFGPFAFIPILVVGFLIDLLVFKFTGTVTIIAAGIGILLYLISFILSIKVLKTEAKAQKRACEIMLKNGLATQEEVEMMKKLFKLYNIQYFVDIILEILELILRILELAIEIQSNNN
ncbi:MAG: zinc metallopeptidase [Clostridia bacterium]|nr:zinc metallopeptidase [Clostridia bacterium]